MEVKLSLAPAWTTDWITDEGKRKLKEYGIAPPEKTADIRALKGEQPVVQCPQCGLEEHRDAIALPQYGV